MVLQACKRESHWAWKLDISVYRALGWAAKQAVAFWARCPLLVWWANPCSAAVLSQQQWATQPLVPAGCCWRYAARFDARPWFKGQQPSSSDDGLWFVCCTRSLVIFTTRGVSPQPSVIPWFRIRLFISQACWGAIGCILNHFLISWHKLTLWSDPLHRSSNVFCLFPLLHFGFHNVDKRTSCCCEM